MVLKIPARKRSIIIKLLLFIPLFWIAALIFFNIPNKLNEDAPSVEMRPPIQQIQGFGPPMAINVEPEEKGVDVDAAQGNIPKPNKQLFDMNSPIYKHGDPTQAGEMGKAVQIEKNKLSEEEKRKYDDGFQKNAFNQYASDLISVHRSLPITADEECKTEKYAEDLPDTSVIICFHNEAWSVLLRTVHSVIERTPEKLLNEIILVDDFSDMDHTKKPLDDYMLQFSSKVRVMRLEKREGLIRARLKGASIAKGTVITYLDSHCECMEGWIEPLLDRIQKDHSTVVEVWLDEYKQNYYSRINTQLKARRTALQTEDENKIDSMFWDRRGKSEKGNTLIIGFEGNAGYYEAGILVTPLSLNYSVLGFNMPGFGESTGAPYPSAIVNSVEAVMQFAIEKLGFPEDSIVLYAWSIGGFPASWASANYPCVKALVLDASFDDLVPLAVIRMPSIMRSLVHYTVRRYLDLPIAKYLSKYPGPVRLIRRYHDEIVTEDGSDEETRRASNRANELLLCFFRTRYSGLLLTDDDEEHVRAWLAKDPAARVMSFNSSDPELHDDLSATGLSQARRNILIEQLCFKHFLDFEASHNVPLDALYFDIPTAIKGAVNAAKRNSANIP